MRRSRKLRYKPTAIATKSFTKKKKQPYTLERGATTTYDA